jgi:hypothetical protein
MFSFFRKAKTSAEGFDEYLADLGKMIDSLPPEAQMSAAMFAVMDRAYERGLSEDERTDVHVAALCAYRDTCMMGLLQLVSKNPHQLPHYSRNVMRNAMESQRKFWTLVKRWDLGHGPITIP